MEEHDNEDPEQTEFTFDELDDAAREKARDTWRELDMQDEWWDGVYDDAVTMAKLIGIEIGMRSFRTLGNNKTLYEPDIWFQLHAQGSGACYSGQLVVEQLNGAATRLAAEIGAEAEAEDTGDGNRALHALANQAQQLYDLIVLHAFTLRLLGGGPDPDNGNFFQHEEIGTCDVLTIDSNHRAFHSFISDDNSYPEHLVEAINDYLDGFATWIHDRLDDEADYRYSDDYVDDAIRNNDCLFDEFGSII